MHFDSFFVHPNKSSYYWSAIIGRDVDGGTETTEDSGYAVLSVTQQDYEQYVKPEGWDVLEWTREITIDSVEYVAAAYAQALETLLWSSTLTDDDGEDYSADDRHGYWEIDQNSREELLAAIKGMIDTDEVLAMIAEDTISADSFGHNFILSSNGHGTGFWDRGYSNGRELHDLCVSSYDLYLGDDGVLYIS